MDEETAARFAALEAATAVAMAGLLRGLVAAKAIDVRVAEDILHATVDRVRTAAPGATADGSGEGSASGDGAGSAGGGAAAAGPARGVHLRLADALERAAFHMRD